MSNDHHTGNHQLGNILLLDCRSLIEEFEEVFIKHFYRETNHCADILTNDAPVLVGDLQKQKKLSTIIPLSRPLFTISPLSLHPRMLHLLHTVGGYDSTGPLYSGNYGVYCIAKGWFQSSMSSLGP